MSQAKAGQFSPSDNERLIFTTPDFLDFLVVEVLSKTLENYSALPRGTPFPANSPAAALFPNHRLTLEVEQSDKVIVRYYAADRTQQQAYNASISYSGESKDHPIFTRDYIIRRTEYEALDRLEPLTGITSATVLTGGHEFDDDPVVELSGGTGTGGEITAVVSNGAVVGLTIVNPGNYTVAPTIAITGGTGATGEVTLQAQGAVLVKEDMLARTGDERIDALYVLVRLTWETLPGPWIPSELIDPLRGPVQRRRRAVVNTGQVSSETATAQTTYEGRDGSSIVSWEIVETYSNGTGTAGNPAFRIINAPIVNDQDRGDVHSYSQLVNISAWKVLSASIVTAGSGGQNGTRTAAGTTGTGTKFQASVTVAGGAISAILSITVEGLYTVRPTNPQAEPVTVTGTGPLAGATLNVVLVAVEESSVVSTADRYTEIRYEPFDEFHLKKIVTWFDFPCPINNKPEWIDELRCYRITFRQLQAAPGSTPPMSSVYSTGGVLSGGAVSTIAVDAAGTLYSAIAFVDIAQSTGEQAVAHATMKANGIAAVAAAGTGAVPGTVLTLVGGTFTTAGTVAVATTKVVSATIAAAGSGGSDGTQTVTGTNGTGTKFQASVTVAGGIITAILSITVGGSYTVNPTALANEPVTGASLTGAQLNVVMGVNTVTITNGGSYTQLPQLTMLTAVPASGKSGVGYEIDEEVTLAGGAGTPPVVKVATITGGADVGPIATVTIDTAGPISSIPTTTGFDGQIVRANWTQASTTELGSGAEFTATYKSIATTTGGGSGVQLQITFGVNTIVVDDGGSRYVTATPPDVTITGSSANGTATATVTAETVGESSAYVVKIWGETINTALTLSFWATLPVPGIQTIQTTGPWVKPGRATFMSDFVHDRPWLGIEYNVIPPLSCDVPMLDQRNFQFGTFTPEEIFQTFSITSPAAANGIGLKIHQRTIHNGYHYFRLDGTYEEIVAASTITGQYGDLYCLESRQKRIEGDIYMLDSRFTPVA